MPTRPHAPSRAVRALAVASVLLALAGCSSSPGAPPDDATHITTGGRHACTSGEAVALDGQSRTFILSGQCGTVSLNGNGDTLRIDHAVAIDVQGRSGTIRISGRVGSVVINGNGVALTADSIGSVKITGQNNSITAPAIGAVMVQGDHNVVATDSRPSDYRVNGQDNTLSLN